MNQVASLFLALSPLIAFFSGVATSSVWVIAALAYLSFFLNHLNKETLWSNNKNIFIPLIILLTYCLVSILWTVEPNYSLKSLAITSLMLLMIIFPIRLEEEDIRYFLYGFIVTLILLATDLFSEGRVTSFIRSLAHYQDYVFARHHLNRCLFLMTLCFWPIFHLFRPKPRVALWVCYFIILILGDSLACMVAFILSTILYLIIKNIPKNYLPLMFNILLASLLLVALSWQVLWLYMLNYNVDLLLDSAWPPTIVHRFYIWQYVMDKILQGNILLGYGFDSSRFLDNPAIKVFGNESLLPLHPHNNYLQILLELGIVGVLLIGIIIWQIMKYIFQEQDQTKLAIQLAVLMSYLFIGFTALGVWQSWWLADGLIVTCILRAKPQLAI